MSGNDDDDFSPLDLTIKPSRPTSGESPPPLVINSDAEDSESDASFDEDELLKRRSTTR